MNSIRGFGFQDINIKTVNSEGEESEEGGEKFVQFNLELTIPCSRIWGSSVSSFYDTGNVFGPDDPIDFGTSARRPDMEFDGILPSARFASKAATFWIHG
jgi:outer membrane protein insertion porin family